MVWVLLVGVLWAALAVVGILVCSRALRRADAEWSYIALDQELSALVAPASLQSPPTATGARE